METLNTTDCPPIEHPTYKPYDAVFEGGGVKIPALVGATMALNQRGWIPSHVAGSSSGAIVAAFLAAGYTPQELYDIVMGIDFQNLLDSGGGGTPRRIYNLINNYGMYKGDWFLGFIREHLKAKNVESFKDLLSSKEDLESNMYRWRLKVYSADISLSRQIRFPDDAWIYGINPDEMEVALAVRASMAIPAFFYPVQLSNNYLVDGGLISNFPINTFDQSGEPSWPTFGMLLAEQNMDKPNTINILHQFMTATIKTMLSAHDKTLMHPDDFKYRTIKIPVLGVNTTDFNIDKNKKQDLINSGYSTTNDFLQNWTWESYKEWYTKLRITRAKNV